MADAELITIVPEGRRAYVWARNEMRKYFPKPDRYRITKLDERRDKTGVHVSMFVGEPDEEAIWRVFWMDTNSVKYSIVVNYDELRSEHPELVDQLIRNGQQAYEEQLAFEREAKDLGFLMDTAKFFVDQEPEDDQH